MTGVKIFNKMVDDYINNTKPICNLKNLKIKKIYLNFYIETEREIDTSLSQL